MFNGDLLDHLCLIVQYLNEHSFRRQLQAASFLQRKDEDLHAFSDEDELSSSEEVVNKGFDKKEFLLRFQASMTEAMSAAISAAMSEVISKLLDRPAKTCRNKQHKKLLHEEKAVTGKRELFPIWEYGLERGWIFKIVD